MAFGKSTDGGITWTHSIISTPGNPAYPYCLGVDPQHPDTVYLGGYEGSLGALYRSLDAGERWTKLSTSVIAGSIYSVSVDPSDPSVIFAAAGGGIYRSTDFGSSWIKVSDVIVQCMDLVIDPTEPSRVWVSTYGQGVFQSTDGGTTWAAMNEGLGSSLVTKLALDPGAFLFAGTDGASTYRWPLSMGVEEEEGQGRAIPATVRASPDPARSGATIYYSTETAGDVRLLAYDLQGRLVATIYEGFQSPGAHEIWWDACGPPGRPLASGVYLLRLASGGEAGTGRLVVSR